MVKKSKQILPSKISDIEDIREQALLWVCAFTTGRISYIELVQKLSIEQWIFLNNYDATKNMPKASSIIVKQSAQEMVINELSSSIATFRSHAAGRNACPPSLDYKQWQVIIENLISGSPTIEDYFMILRSDPLYIYSDCRETEEKALILKMVMRSLLQKYSNEKNVEYIITVAKEQGWDNRIDTMCIILEGICAHLISMNEKMSFSYLKKQIQSLLQVKSYGMSMPEILIPLFKYLAKRNDYTFKSKKEVYMFIESIYNKYAKEEKEDASVSLSPFNDTALLKQLFTNFIESPSTLAELAEAESLLETTAKNQPWLNRDLESKMKQILFEKKFSFLAVQ